MMSAPSIRLEDTTTGQVIELAGSELPEPPLRHGGKLRKSVTRYPGDIVSVQLLGTEDHPIQFSGVLDDTWSGQAGRAEQVKDALEQMWRAQNVVVLEYRSMKRWGLLEVGIDEVLPWRYEYTVNFTPLWRKPPGGELIELEALPTDAATLVGEYVNDLGDWVNDPPEAIGGADLVVQLILKMAAVQNEATALMQKLEGVTDFAELTAELAGEAVGFCRGMVSGLGYIITRAQQATAATLGAVGVDTLAATEYTAESERRAHKAREQCMELYKRLLNAIEPVSNRTHTVRQGETLRGLARLYYDDFTRWTDIADANQLDGDELTPGMTLVVPRD